MSEQLMTVVAREAAASLCSKACLRVVRPLIPRVLSPPCVVAAAVGCFVAGLLREQGRICNVIYYKIDKIR